MKHKRSSEHDKWHRRVEGQLRDVMQFHPEWFSFSSETDKRTCINSIAKRIVGEIVVATDCGDPCSAVVAVMQEKTAVAPHCRDVPDMDHLCVRDVT